MTEPSPVPDGPDVAYCLERHQQWRQQGIPTLSVLCGPLSLSLQYWRAWCVRGQRAPVTLPAVDLASVVRRWTAALAEQRDLHADALTFLAARTDRPATELKALLATRTAFDRERYFDSLPQDDTALEPDLACRWLLGQVAVPEELAGQLDAALAARPDSWLRVLRALLPLVPAAVLPGLVLRVEPPHAEVASAARLLASLVTHLPALPAALVLTADELERYQRCAPESQARALLRAGLIRVPSWNGAAANQQLQALGGEVGTASAVARLLADGVTPALVQSFALVVQSGSPRTPREDEAARSAAERFLYERLASLPATAGLFELNGSLPFRFGPTDAEIDLLARSLRLAIELDGYFHFLTGEAYRRDRRKDFALQRRGYLVLRFLSSDVVDRLDELLDTILAAVAHCKAGGPSPEEP